jgi:hypothetical protein
VIGVRYVFGRDCNSSGRNVVRDLRRLCDSEEVAHSVRLRNTVLLVRLVVYSVVHVAGNRWVAQAVQLAVWLGLSNVWTIVGCRGVHGSLVAWRARGLTGVCSFRLSTRDSMRRVVARRSTAGVGVQAALTLLNLGLDATTVWGLADLRQDRSHVLNEEQTQLGGSELESGLNNVVAVGVAHESLELLKIKKFLDHGSLGAHLSAADALLNDIGAELLHGELGDLALEAETHRGGEVGIVEVKDVLHHVVTERILDQVEAVCGDLANKVDLLEAGSVVNAALENTASVAVSSDCDAMLAYSIEDELSLRRLEVVETLLNDMVAVEVLDEVDNLTRESLDDCLSLGRS